MTLRTSMGVLTLAAISGAGVADQTPAPCESRDIPAVARLRTVTDAVRQQDLTRLRRVLDEIWSPSPTALEARESAMVTLARLSGQSDGLGEIRVCTRGDSVAVAGLRNDLTGAVDQIAIGVSNEDGSPVSFVQVAAAARLYVRPDPVASDDARAALLGRYLDRLTERGAFSGVVMVGRAGLPVYAGAFGEANRAMHRANTIDTPFNVASLSKMFTAVAVLQLVESGELTLETPVAALLPNASTDARFPDVRVKHLLSHTSGIDRDPNALAFAPGSQFLYSNAGYRVLGDLIQATTHLRFEDYLRLRVLGPAAMASTMRVEASAVSPWLTLGYTLEHLGDGPRPPLPVWKANPYLHTISGGAMGGLFSTAPDLLRFATALTDGTLLTPETVELMKAPKPELGAPGYGFGVMRIPMSSVWGHGGDLPGADAALEFYSGGRVAIVLANVDNVSAPILQHTRALFHDQGATG